MVPSPPILISCWAIQVSDDDLLEILGQSRDPLAVQKHIKKCFEGFKTMEVIAPGKQLNRNFEVHTCPTVATK